MKNTLIALIALFSLGTFVQAAGEKPNIIWLDGSVIPTKDVVGIHVMDEFWDLE